MTKSILLVDDEYRVQEAIRITLETMADWSVILANSGSEGIEVAEKQQPDAILLDLMMPDLDGLQTFERLQANPKTKDLPVILMTARFEPDEQQQVIDKGIRAVITKPFDPITLADRISMALGW